MAYALGRGLERRDLFAYPGDGLLDIFLGLVLLDASTVLAGGPRGSGLSIVLLFPLFLVVKEGVTAPRLGPQDLVPDRAPGRLGPMLLIAASFLVSAAALLGLAAAGVIPLGQASWEQRLWSILPLAGLAAVACAGYRAGAGRLTVYAAAVAVAMVAHLGWGVPHMPAAIATFGGGITVFGAVWLGRFLHHHPRRTSSP